MLLCQSYLLFTLLFAPYSLPSYLSPTCKLCVGVMPVSPPLTLYFVGVSYLFIFFLPDAFNPTLSFLTCVSQCLLTSIPFSHPFPSLPYLSLPSSYFPSTPSLPPSMPPSPPSPHPLPSLPPPSRPLISSPKHKQTR